MSIDRNGRRHRPKGLPRQVAGTWEPDHREDGSPDVTPPDPWAAPIDPTPVDWEQEATHAATRPRQASRRIMDNPDRTRIRTRPAWDTGVDPMTLDRHVTQLFDIRHDWRPTRIRRLTQGRTRITAIRMDDPLHRPRTITSTDPTLLPRLHAGQTIEHAADGWHLTRDTTRRAAPARHRTAGTPTGAGNDPTPGPQADVPTQPQPRMRLARNLRGRERHPLTVILRFLLNLRKAGRTIGRAWRRGR